MSLPPPIKPVRVDVVGIHPQFARLLIIEVELDQVPPPRWVECFENVGKEMPWIEMHPPTVRTSKILLHPSDSDIEQQVAHVEERVLLANQRWLALLAAEAPPSQANAHDSDMFSADVRERIAAARARTRTMSEAFSVQGFWRSDAWVTEDLMSLEGVTQN
jgi:hypothetical protein